MWTTDVRYNLSPTERLLYWITEREQIRLRKESGLPKPWTDDYILSTYRFCNVRRMDDKVSRWLMDNWYGPFKDHPNMLAAVALARFINLPASLSGITSFVFTDGSPRWDDIKGILQDMKARGETIWNAAYMVRGNDGVDKIESVVGHNVRPLWEKHLSGDYMINPYSMKATWERIKEAYGFGSFMAGQVVADLRWAITGDWGDKDTWAPEGPGSKRGLRRLLGEDKPWSGPDGFPWALVFMKAGLPESISSRLEAHDYQNCLCEFSKYEKALMGEGRPKQKYNGGAT